MLPQPQSLDSRVSAAFLHNCLYAVRETGIKLVTADGQSISYYNETYYIGESATTGEQVMQAIEYYYEHSPGAFDDDHMYIRNRVLRHRMKTELGLDLGE